MQTVPAVRIDILTATPEHEVAVTFAFSKANEIVYLNVDGDAGNGEPIQQFAVKFADFQNVVTAWLDGENDDDN